MHSQIKRDLLKFLYQQASFPPALISGVNLAFYHLLHSPYFGEGNAHLHLFSRPLTNGQTYYFVQRNTYDEFHNLDFGQELLDFTWDNNLPYEAPDFIANSTPTLISPAVFQSLLVPPEVLI